MRFHLYSFVALSFFLSLAACSNPEVLPLEYEDVQLSRISSCGELDNLRTVQNEPEQNLSVNDTVGISPDGAPEAAAGDSDSETNVQVEGVDEMDLVKAVGDYLYSVDQSNNEIVVIRRKPLNQAGIVQRLKFSSRLRPIGLYMNEDRGVLLAGRSYESKDLVEAEREADIYYYGGEVGTKLLSLKRKSDGTIEKSGHQVLRGSFRGSRLIEDRLLLVQEIYVPRRYRNRDFNYEVAPVKQHLPASQIEGEETRLNECQDIYAENALRDRNRVRPTVSALQCVVDVSLNRSEKKPQTNCVAGQSTSVIYVSLDNFYLATTDWGSDQTPIHRFELKADKVEYRGSQVVEGRLLNQFSMDEHKGHLRVAYSESLWGARVDAPAVAVDAVAQTTSEEPPPPSSAVESFKLIPDGLLPKGHVGDLGPNETIHAVRFMGDRGYVVTFRRVDPLYVLDLSNPEDLKVLGELKITGFSEYLHPISEDLLFSVGQEATDEGFSQGLAFSIFDVSDPTNPEMVERIHDETGYQYSEAERDHHAFLFVESKATVSVPVTDWNKNETFFLLLEVGESGMEERAKVPSSSSSYYGPSRSFFSDGIFVFLTPEEAIWRLDSDLSTDAKRIDLR